MASEKSTRIAENQSMDAPAESEKSRRRLLKGIGIGAPLLLANRPAMAMMGCSISGFMSVQVGTSLTNHSSGACNGWSPGNWSEAGGNSFGTGTAEAWSIAGVSTSEAFNSRFDSSLMQGCHLVVEHNGSKTITSYKSALYATFLQMLSSDDKSSGKPTKGSWRSIARHAAAAYLNALFIEKAPANITLANWMPSYSSSAVILGTYLLYELTHQTSEVPSGAKVVLETSSGVLLADSSYISEIEYASLFENMANGNGSNI